MASTLVQSRSPEPPDGQQRGQGKRGRFVEDGMGDMESSPSPPHARTAFCSIPSTSSGAGGSGMGINIAVSANQPMLAHSQSLFSNQGAGQYNVLKKARFGVAVGEVGVGVGVGVEGAASSSSSSSSHSSKRRSSSDAGEEEEEGEERAYAHAHTTLASPSLSPGTFKMRRVNSIGEDPDSSDRHYHNAVANEKRHNEEEEEEEEEEEGEGEGRGERREHDRRNLDATRPKKMRYAHTEIGSAAEALKSTQLPLTIPPADAALVLNGPPSAQYVHFLQEAYSSTHQLLLQTKQEHALLQKSNVALVEKLTRIAAAAENENRVLKRGMGIADTKLKELTNQLHRAKHGLLALQQAEKMLAETQHLRQENSQLRELLTNAAAHVSGLEHTIMVLRETADRGYGDGAGSSSGWGGSNFDRNGDVC